MLKTLADSDGLSMIELELALGVQPLAVTKMVTRMSARGLLTRRSADTNGRLARVYLTDTGRDCVKLIDRAWKQLEKEALEASTIRTRSVCASFCAPWNAIWSPPR
ncbi:MarR family transcriptional regulator [Breoghania sp.]|uniref:MarR family winged helix-turn-helix transcriptional regulator n=1 Tax=Breoghania sp. TaxID=2065378 RepID=UPI00262DB7E9|nr:MarR family transcriptional regulator [Breoghania sp.]MDJ0930362.1 MarR family transcriptional regulator [Breoghania sp.]